ncbi:hypothetical protein CRG98_041011 [Punica granatum]|uniref:Uncharacterized protein n=1 Tax=Punica granatum TaxID=22663 RepID=A0A2I0I3N0_PUNGR|nr:hypothetical protein CRG98_041011 [Punica granatum]
MAQHKKKWGVGRLPPSSPFLMSLSASQVVTASRMGMGDGQRNADNLMGWVVADPPNRGKKTKKERHYKRRERERSIQWSGDRHPPTGGHRRTPVMPTTLWRWVVASRLPKSLSQCRGLPRPPPTPMRSSTS